MGGLSAAFLGPTEYNPLLVIALRGVNDMATGLEGNIRLVATDLDGTLLIGGRNLPRPEAFPVIERVCDAGVLFLAASGRQYASLRHLFEPVADRIWQGETLVRHTMPRELALDICRLIEETPGARYVLSGERHSYGSDPVLVDYMAREKGYDISVIERPDEVREAFIKVSFMVDPSRNDEMRAMFEECYGEQCEVVTSGAEWIDVIMRDVNKGTAIRELGEVLDIPLADMAAFGDAENDRQMLEAVGHPYLMDPCFDSMLDLAPRCRRVPTVEGELERLLEKAVRRA